MQPKFENPITELTPEGLKQAIEAGERNLSDLFVEVEKNPNQETRELAKERAHQQLEAILVMMEKLGEITRQGIAKIKEGEIEREIDLDPDSVRSINKVRE